MLGARGNESKQVGFQKQKRTESDAGLGMDCFKCFKVGTSQDVSLSAQGLAELTIVLSFTWNVDNAHDR